MAKSDGRVLISLDIDDNTKAPIEKAESRMKELGKGAGDELEKSMKSNTNKAEETAKKASNVIEGEFKKPVSKKLDIKADQAKKEIKSIESDTAKLVKGNNDVKFKVTGNASEKTKEIFNNAEKVTRGDHDVVIDEKGNARQKTDEVSESLDNAKDKSLKLKDVISGTFIGGALIGGIGAATSAISALGGEAINASDSINKFKSTMKLGGFGNKEINSATKEVQKYANETVYDLGDVSNTTAQLAANGIKNYTQLTEAAGNLNAQAGGNADTFKSVAMMLTQTAGAGKLTTENWNQLADAIPGASGVLQKQMKKNGAFTGNFRDAMQGGKISSKEFSKAITQLGMNDGAKKAAKSTTTFEGSIGNLEAGVVTGIQNIITKIGKQGMTGAINTASTLITGLFGTVATLLSIIAKGGSVLSAFGDIFGETFKQAKIMFGEFAKSIGGNTFSGINKSFQNLSKALKPIMAQLGGILGVIGAGAWNLFSGIVKGVAGQFKNLGSIFKTSGINNFLGDMMGYEADLAKKAAPLGKALGSLIGAIAKSFGGTALKAFGVFGNLVDKMFKTKTTGGITSALTSLLNSFAKNKLAVTTVSDALLGLVAFKGAKKAFSIGVSVIDKTKSGIVKVLGSVKNLKAKAAKFVEFASKVVDKTGKGLRKVAEVVQTAGKSIAKGLRWTARIITKGISKAVSGIWKVVSSTGKLIGKGLKWTAKIVTKGAQLALKGLQKAMSVTKDGVKKLFLAMKANPWTIWVTAILAVIAVFVALYKNNKKFRNFVNGIVKSAKNMAKSVGKWFKSMYNDVVKIIKNLVKNVNKRFGNLWKDAKNVFKNGTKVVRSIINIFYDFFTGKWSKLGKDIKKLSSNMWKLVKSIFKGAYDYLNDLTGGRLGKMVKALTNFGKSFAKGFRNIGKAVGDIWSGVWKSIKNKAQDGINGVISIINAGIGGIDKVIHAFGGSKSKSAIGKIGKVHFAKGTGMLSGSRNPITRPTMAMLNDGNDSPETGNKEAVFLPNGQSGIVKGRNTQAMLPAGTEVLNASETKTLMGMQGITHFAKGSSNWFGNLMSGIGSGIGNVSGWIVKKANGLKKFFTTAEKIIAHPMKSLDSMFNYTKAGSGVVKDITKGMFKNVKKQAGNWWSSLWSMVDLDGGSAGGNWRHNPGLSETNGFGASRSFGSHDGVDFSGPLGSAIRAVHGGKVTHVGKPLHGWPYSQLGDVITVASNDGYQEIYQEFGGMNNVKVGKGDVIKAGQKIATLGRLNGAGSGSHVHIGVSKGSLWDHGGSSTKGWYDVTKMHGKSDGSPKSSKKSGSIKGIKSQVGSGFFKFMSKLANMFGSIGGSGGASYGGASMIKKAAKAMHVKLSSGELATIKSVIMHESGGNAKVLQKVHDINSARGHPAQGLLQFIPRTFGSYALKGHKNILSAYDQLLAMFNDSNWRNDVHTGGWGPSGHRRYANGGIINGLTRAILGEDPLHPREHVINTGKPSSDGLLADAISSRAKSNPSGVYAQMQSLITSAHNSQRMFGTQLQTGSSLQDTANDSKLLKQMAADMHKTAQKDINGDVYLGTNKVGSVLEQRKNKKDFNSQFFAGQLKNQGGLTNA